MTWLGGWNWYGSVVDRCQDRIEVRLKRRRTKKRHTRFIRIRLNTVKGTLEEDGRRVWRTSVYLVTPCSTLTTLVILQEGVSGRDSVVLDHTWPLWQLELVLGLVGSRGSTLQYCKLYGNLARRRNLLPSGTSTGWTGEDRTKNSTPQCKVTMLFTEAFYLLVSDTLMVYRSTSHV